MFSGKVTEVEFCLFHTINPEQSVRTHSSSEAQRVFFGLFFFFQENEFALSLLLVGGVLLLRSEIENFSHERDDRDDAKTK